MCRLCFERAKEGEIHTQHIIKIVTKDIKRARVRLTCKFLK